MSFNYRKNKRELAHSILVYLTQQTLKVTQYGNADSSTYNSKSYFPIPIILIKDSLSSHTHEEIYNAVRLLDSNNHVQFNKNTVDIFKSTVAATIEGEDAMNENFYRIATAKDRAEKIETITKWLLPIISILLASAALIVTIFKNSSKPPTPNIRVQIEEQGQPTPKKDIKEDSTGTHPPHSTKK